MSPRQPDPAALKSRIRQAALEVFSEKGFAGATVAEIAARAEINPATLYRFYAGKRELFASLQRPDLDFPDPQEQQRRADIIRVALQVFSRARYAAATMDEIAAAAGLSKAGLYFYFPSKESLFAEAVENPAGFALIDRLLQEHLAAAGADLEEGLVRVAIAYLHLFEQPDSVNLLRIILSEGVRNSDISTLFVEGVVQRGSAHVARYLERAGLAGGADLVAKVQALFGMLFTWGLVNRLLAGEHLPAARPTEEIARQYVRLFLFGLSGAGHAPAASGLQE